MAYSVNLIPNREFAVIHLNQYEYGVGNTRTVAIYNGDVPFDIPSGSDITIEGVKPDGNAFAYDEGITFEDNEVTFELKDQMTVLSGQFPVEIVIRNSQGRWSTKNLIFDVEAGPVNENTPVSDEDIPAYIDLAHRNAMAAAASATAAASSETSAAASASTAKEKANAASTSATNAATSATSATSSATAALNSATTATEAASTATSAATAAAESEANADMYQEIAKTAADDVRPIITEVGDVVVTENAKEEKLFYVKADFAPKQDFNGYDHAWAPGGGKNKLQAAVASRTHYGITYTLQDDGGIKIQGTSTGTSLYYFFDQTGTSSQTLFANGSYTLTGGVNSNIYITGFTTTDNTGRFEDTGTGVTFTVSNGFIRYIRLVVKSGTTVNNVIYPMIRLASETDATFEPYENICPISGYDSLTVTRTGKNLLTNNMQSVTKNGITMTRNTDGSFTFNGTATASIGFYISEANSSTQTVLPIKPGTYTLSGGASGGTGTTYRLAVYIYVNGTYTRAYSDFGSSRTFTISEDENGYIPLINIYNGTTVSNLTFKPQLEIGDTATEYEPYNGATYPVTFPSAAGTVYGGHVEVYENGTGKLVVNQVTKTFNGTESGWAMASGTHHVAIRTLTPNPDPAMIWSDDHETAGKIIATNGVTPCWHHYNTMRSRWPSCCIRISNSGLYLAIGEEYDTVEKSKAWLAEHPFQIAYYIEPVTYDLTNQQVLQMLDDRNIIWMDANGQIEISFRNNSKLNEYLDIASGVQYDDITQAGTVTETGTKVVDAVQLNPNVNGTIAKRLGQVETVASAAIPKTNISRATNVTSTGSKVVDAYELNASKSGTLAKKIATNTTNITTNTNALNGFKFGFTSDTPPKPGYIVPGGADTVIPFKTGGIVILGTATGTFSQNTVFTLATNVDLSEYVFLGALEQAGKTHAYNLTEYSVGTSKLYRTHFQNDLTGTNPESTTETQFSILIPVADRTDTVTISVKNINGNSPLLTGTITLYGFKGEIEQ